MHPAPRPRSAHRSRALAAAVALILTPLLALPGAALACGALVCDTAQPVVQAGERILFAADGEHLEMHVQITYNGPPSDFGWLLPVPPDVEVGLSDPLLFSRLDAVTQPTFSLVNTFEDCGFDGVGGSGGGGGEGEGEGEGEGPGVDVVQRQTLGPYEQVILRADTVDVLVDWLVENGYQRPAGADAILDDYVDTSVFVALKLRADARVTDILPISLRSTAPIMAIPLRPTAIAATPDMGILVYVLGGERAVPGNYLHVRVNDALLDWQQLGQNYAALVAAAVDEAGGRAFVTDFAGPHANVWLPLSLGFDLAALEEVRTVGGLLASGAPPALLADAEMTGFLLDAITPPDGITAQRVIDCFACVSPEVPVDGAAIAERIRAQILPRWQAINALFERLPYLTRLYTAISPDEMSVDPIFAFNGDMGPVARDRRGAVYYPCEGDAVVETAGGARYRASRLRNPEAVARQGGETVRGGAPAARVIERTMAAGQPEVMTDNTELILARFAEPLPPAFGPGGAPALDGAGCDCDATGGGGAGWALLGMVGLLGIIRRRR